MYLYFKFKNEIKRVYVKSLIDEKTYVDKKITCSLKNFFTKKCKHSIDVFIENEFNINIEKCAFCDENAYYDIKYILKKNDDKIFLDDISIYYIKNYYCKGKNKNCKGKKINANSVEFVSKTYRISDKEALKKIHSRNKTPFYKENHNSKEEYKLYQTRDINFFSNEEQYNNYIKKLKYSHSSNWYIDKYGENDGKIIYEKISKMKDSSSFEYFKNKYKNYDLALKYFNEKNDKCKQTLETFINRYGKEDGSIKYEIYEEKRKNANSIENYIKLYGEIDGQLKRNEWIEKIRGNNIFYSKESFNFFNIIDSELNLNGLFGEHEYFIRDNSKNTLYFYDYTLLDLKIIVEYNGSIWHPNKEVFTTEAYKNWKHPFNDEISADDIYNKDKYKINFAKSNGYNIIVVWDFDKNKKEKVINFIQDIKNRKNNND